MVSNEWKVLGERSLLAFLVYSHYLMSFIMICSDGLDIHGVWRLLFAHEEDVAGFPLWGPSCLELLFNQLCLWSVF